MINANKIAFTYDKKKEFIKDLTFNIEKGKNNHNTWPKR